MKSYVKHKESSENAGSAGRRALAAGVAGPAGSVARPHPLSSLAERDAALEPQRLSATAQAAARALLREGESANTRASYQSAMRYWCAWYAARYGAVLALPVPAPVVIQFIVDHAARLPDAAEPAPPAAPRRAPQRARGGASKRHEEPGQPDDPSPRTEALVTDLPRAIDAALVENGYKARLGPPSLATLIHRIAVLSKAHQLARPDEPSHGTSAPSLPGSFEDGVAPVPAAAARHRQLRPVDTAASTEDVIPALWANPCAEPAVRELLARTRRAYAKRGALPRRQRALTKDPLEQLLATCDDSVKGIRDRALLLFAWATGGRRRSEVTGAMLEQLQRIDERSFVYNLAHSKTNQFGEHRPENAKPLVGRAATAMQAWVDVLAAQNIRSGAIFRRVRRGGHVGEALEPAAVRDIVRERCAVTGIEGYFSAHSLRAGFVTEAGKKNVPLAETMAMTGHQSVATVLSYFRAESVLSSQASQLLEDD
jgi:site-specific recombinase XerC